MGETNSATDQRWRVATCMHGIPVMGADGVALHDADPSAWADAFQEIAGLGFSHVELSDGHLRLADVDPTRSAEIRSIADEFGLQIPSHHVQRRSIIMPGSEQENLDYAHRAIDGAAEFGITVFSTGLHQPFTKAQKDALWFWLGQGSVDRPEMWDVAVQGFRELGQHAADVGMIMSLELYEDTFLGTTDSAIRLVEEIGLDNVGLNPDVGNLIRLHRPIEDWRDMYARMLPYTNYWHLKNYTRDEMADGSLVTSVPSSLESGLINYRQVIRDAVHLGYRGVFLMEHYGGDSLGMCRTNARYVESILNQNAFIR